MAYRDLREFISALEGRGDIKRIRAEVDPELEVTEIADRMLREGGPALLFEKVKGHDIPILINAFGSEDRVCLALEVESLKELEKKFELLTNQEMPRGMWEKFRMFLKLKDWAGYLPKTAKDGPCKEVIIKEGASLKDLPILKCWPEDGGRFITLPLVFTKDPGTGRQNCGIYRMQVYDDLTTGMHWHTHKEGNVHMKRYGEMGAKMEVAVALGADPAITFAAALPLPENLDEMVVAGFLRGEGVEMVKAETVDIEVPAHSEIILEGYVDPEEIRMEGPFGDHTGYYTPPAPFPVFHLTCITHRRDPIYHTTIVGRPPKEDNFLGMAMERLLLPLIRWQFPEIKDIHFPFEGIFHNLVIVSIEKRYPGHARKVMHGLWGLGQAMFSKVIVVVEEEDIRDLGRICWKVLTSIDPQRDFEFVLGPIETLDHASRLPNFGSKVGIDATRKWPEEGFSRPWPKEAVMTQEMADQVTRRWRDYGL